MQSKTSFFNKTVFKKNLTRFAPVMLLYTLCLILGMMMMYAERTTVRNFWFASRMCECIQIMGPVNLIYAPLVAMLLFGDLYNSRMCNALHAMPLRRESWFVTSVLSGLVFSLLPTAVMALLSMPLLAGTCVTNAWQIALWWFLGTNLEYLCFFGIAVFSAFCAGTRLSMALVYAALNGWAYVVYFLLDAVYTPMLFGVVTPYHWAEVLTPIASMDNPFAEVQNYNELLQLFQGRESEMAASFWLNPEPWRKLILWAIVGLVFGVIGLLLYRKRKLECAGDAVAFSVLIPVFQVICSVGIAVLSVMVLQIVSSTSSSVLRSSGVLYIVLACGLVVGWFAGKMLTERTIRVFRLRNWRGLAILAAVAAVSLAGTYLDVLDFEDWIPEAEDVESVTLWMNGKTTWIEEEDIQKIIRLHQIGQENRIKNTGAYPLSYVQSLPEDTEVIAMPDGDGFLYGEGGYDTQEEHLHAVYVEIQYQMKNGTQPSRCYIIWAEQEAGDIVREFTSRWDVVWEWARNGWYDDFDLNRIKEISLNGKRLPAEETTVETAQSLMAAIQADCEERTMTQHGYFHSGYFRYFDETYEDDITTESLYLRIYTYCGEDFDFTGVGFEIYADSRHTLQWLEDHGMLTYEICEGNPY
ncbi:MAG: hypothetical protein ACI4PH_01630 [Faecousia sp.]